MREALIVWGGRQPVAHPGAAPGHVVSQFDVPQTCTIARRGPARADAGRT